MPARRGADRRLTEEISASAEVIREGDSPPGAMTVPRIGAPTSCCDGRNRREAEPADTHPGWNPVSVTQDSVATLRVIETTVGDIESIELLLSTYILL